MACSFFLAFTEKQASYSRSDPFVNELEWTKRVEKQNGRNQCSIKWTATGGGREPFSCTTGVREQLICWAIIRSVVRGRDWVRE